MTEEEDFIVQKSYQPTEEEKQAIAQLSADGLKSENWDSGRKGILSFKANIREYMYEEQHKLCAYCRIHVPSSCVTNHIEHIVFKDAHPQWMFLPENLCVSCPTCNSNKWTKEVLNNPHTEIYPNESAEFKIIHPLYDRYSDHIELIGGILYRGKTSKGVFTIETCKLSRVGLAEERVDQRMRYENKGSVVFELIGLLKNSDLYVDKSDKLIAYINDIVKKYKQNQTPVVDKID
jgi:uncharacterized protein (TIGR02646 family)